MWGSINELYSIIVIRFGKTCFNLLIIPIVLEHLFANCMRMSQTRRNTKQTRGSLDIVSVVLDLTVVDRICHGHLLFLGGF